MPTQQINKRNAFRGSEPSTATSKGNFQRERIQKRKTKSCPNCSAKHPTEDASKNSDISFTCVPPSVSMFGKYCDVGSQNRNCPSWFNFPQGTNVGVIDSLACLARGESPSCYSVNIKRGESVPLVLPHNIEVRVGQNGVVREERKEETAVSEVCYKSDDHHKEGDFKPGMKGNVPLSWEEQLNWRNVSIYVCP